MDGLTIALKLLIAFALGAAIGLEREVNEKSDTYRKKPTAILGVRTFSLTALLGCVAGFLYQDFLFLSLFVSTSVLIILSLFYVLDTKKSGEHGITTEVAVIFSYLIGLLLAIEVFPVTIVLAISVVLILMLAQKSKIKSLVSGIARKELNAFISYLIVAAVILPFLPNTTYSLSDIPGAAEIFKNAGLQTKELLALELFNPFKIWFIVALITGLDMAGYLMERTIGQKRGYLLTSAVGGFISSTAVTQSLAQQSKDNRSYNSLLSAAIISNLISFIQIAILISGINFLFLTRLLPTIACMIITSLAIFFFFYRKKDKAKQTIKQTKTAEIFDLVPALRFAFIFLVITVISKISLELFGNSGLFVTTALGAAAGLDAVMINTSQLAGKLVNYQTGIIAFIIANAVNLGAKALYSFMQGKNEFAYRLTISFVLIIISSLAGLLLS